MQHGVVLYQAGDDVVAPSRGALRSGNTEHGAIIAFRAAARKEDFGRPALQRVRD